jgi:hypothetical protein
VYIRVGGLSTSFNSFDRMRSLMGGHALRISEKRRDLCPIGPQTIRAFHLPPRSVR